MMVPVLSNASIDNISNTFRLMDTAVSSFGASIHPQRNWPPGAQGLSNASFARAGNPLDALARQQEEDIAQAWRTGLFNLAAAHNADGLTPTVTGTIRSLMTFGPKAIDLRGLNVHSVNGMHLVAILRCTHTWKADVPGWQDALALACKALERSGLSVEDAAGDLFEE